MAEFPNLTITSEGKHMLIQAQNGHTLKFTSGKLGSGVLADSDDVSSFTDLKAAKMTLPITNADDSNKEKLVLTFDVSNSELETGFISRELGIFAKLDSGEETLYAYSNAGNNYDYIPGKDTPTDENRIVVSLVTSSAASIEVLVDGSIVYVHKSDVEDMIAAHDANASAHANGIAGKSTGLKTARNLKVNLASANAQSFNGTGDATGIGVSGILPVANGGTGVNSLANLNLSSTIADTKTPTSDTDTIRNQLSELANRIKAATGASGWKSNPATTLASLATLVSNLASGSDVTWSGKKFTNAKLGISGLIDTNGYVSFGPNFGGLIIQWVYFGKTGSPIKLIFPIAFTTNQYVAVGSDYNTSNNGNVLNFYDKNPEYCMISGQRIRSKTSSDVDVYGTGILLGW